MGQLDSGNAAWILTSASLVFLMTPGVAFFYGGMVRAKAVLNMMIMEAAALSVTMIMWVLWGWSIAYAGTSVGGIFGDPATGFLLKDTMVSDKGVFTSAALNGNNYPVSVDVAFQSAFAMITVALICGAIAERVKYSTWMIFVALWITFDYAPLAHMVWNGGLLSADGAISQAIGAAAHDFAGGTVVHINAAVAALVIVLIIGMTVVSIGTSLPEIIVSLAASLHEQRDLAVGTALGSNIINILLILGLAALVRPFTVHSDVLRRELPLMLLVSVVAGSVLYDGQLSRSDGIFLLFLAVLWLLFIVKLARQAERQGTDSLTREQLAELPREGGLPVAFLWLGIALIIMPVATRMVVDNATVLANYFAISELTMGLTAIAIGTSLPELATAIAGVRKGENDIAVGNIIGANIFNIVIVLGLPALITPGEIDPLAYSRDYSVMLLVSIIFALLCWRRSPQSGRGVGVLLTGGFIVWLAMLYWLSPILVE